MTSTQRADAKPEKARRVLVGAEDPSGLPLRPAAGRLLVTLAARLRSSVCLCSACFFSGFYGRLRANERALYAAKEGA